MENIKELLVKKKQLFKEYGDILSLMLDSNVDELGDFVFSLDEIREKIDGIDGEILRRLELMGGVGQEILLDIKNRSNREELPKERQELFDISQEIFSMIYGYNSLMEQISLKAKRFQSEAMKNIEKINDEGKGTKYLKTLNTNFDNGTFLNLKK